jgi:hypothetical protein
MFEKLKRKHNNLDFKYFLWNKFHYLQNFNAQNLMQIKNPFAHLKHSNIWNKQLFFNSNVIFIIKCAPFIFKLNFFLALMIKRTKVIEIGEIPFYNTFECIWFKCPFGFKIMNFEFVTWQKVTHFYVVKSIDAQYTWYRIKMLYIYGGKLDLWKI